MAVLSKTIGDGFRQRFTRIAGWLVVLLGLGVLAGWHLRSSALVQILPTFAPMQYNAALCFIGLGVALLCAAHQRTKPAFLLSGVVASFAGLTCLQYAVGADFGIDQLLLRPHIATATSHVGRMSPLTGMCFMLVGAGLSLVAARGKGEWWLIAGGVLASLACSIGVVTMVGYLANVQVSYLFSQMTRMAAHSAAGVILITSGVLALAWDRSRRMQVAPARWIPSTLALSLVAVLVVVGGESVTGFRAATDWRQRSEQMCGRLNDLELTVLEAQGGGRGFGLAEVPVLRTIFEADRTRAAALLETIKLLTGDSPRQTANLAQVREATKSLFAWYDRLHATRARDGAAAAVAQVATEEGEALVAAVRQKIDAMLAEEARAHQAGNAGVAFQARSTQILQLSGGILALLLVAAAGWMMQRELQRRRASEAELQHVLAVQTAILDNAGNAVIATTPEGVITLFNPAAELMLGYTKEEMVGRQTPAVFHCAAEMAERARLFATELGIPLEPGFEAIVARSRRRLPNVYEWTYLHKDGRRFPVLLSVTAMRDEAGLAVGFLGLAVDMADRKRMESELRQAKEGLERANAGLADSNRQLENAIGHAQEMAFKAEAANRAKSGFLAAMSHEIRTPMNGVLGFTSLLLDTSLKDDQREYVETIRQSGERLMILINDILDFSKIEAGHLELEHSPFELRPCLEECVKLLLPKAVEKKLLLDLTFATGLPREAVGDCGRIRQILLNLLSNAIKFTHDGEVRVEVRHLGTAGDAARIELKVSDTGIGIPADKINRLFQPFTQVDASTSCLYGGTGLGLAISRRLAQAMGGTITVQSVAPHGATFTVELTLGAVGESPEDRPPEPAPRPEPESTATTSVSVLVAEDTVVNQRLMLAFLNKLGYRADVVADGIEVMDMLSRRDYDVILMDVHMPRLDGLDTTRRIRAELPRARQPHIVAVTASVLKEETEGCLQAGMDLVISKPVARAALGHALAKVSRQRRQGLRPSEGKLTPARPLDF